MKSIIHKFNIIVLSVLCFTTVLHAQGDIEVTVQNVSFNTTSTSPTLTFTIFGRQGASYSSGGTGGLFSANLRYDIQVVVSSSGTFTLNNSSGSVSNLNSTILTGSVTNASSVQPYAPQGTSPAGTNAFVGFTLTRNNATDPDLPSSTSTPVALFTVTYPYTISSGSTINTSSSTFTLRTLTGTRGSSWSSFSASFNSFSPGPPVALSIGLTDFTAKATDDRRTQLNWETAIEQNTDHYDVERSVDGAVSFPKVVATVRVTGNSNNLLKYQTYDQYPQLGDNFYRLKIVPREGESAYSEIRKVNFKASVSNIHVYPTLNHDGIVHITLPANMQGVQFLITNAAGQRIQVPIEGSELSRTINLSHQASGVYLLQVIDNNSAQSFRISYQP